jgi:large subunit ribosomal protein L13
MNKTAFYNKQEQDQQWFLIDAESKTLGRLSTQISALLLGKNNINYTPGQKIKHAVIVINAEKITISGKKETDKFYYRHSGRPGGLTIETFKELKNRIPNRIIEKSIKGMLPKNSLGRDLFTRLKVYVGSEHPHAAQKPKKITNK